jgi:hypothetical protein
LRTHTDLNQRVLRPGWQIAGYMFLVPAMLGLTIRGWEPWATELLIAIGLPPWVAVGARQLPFLLMTIGAACIMYAYRKSARPSAKDLASGKF